jgi:hypothetical protein
MRCSERSDTSFFPRASLTLVHFASSERSITELEEAFASVAKQAEMLGAVWDDISGSYKAPKEADSETKKAIEQIRWDTGLLRFGIRLQELRERNLIMTVLGEAIGLAPSQR